MNERPELNIARCGGELIDGIPDRGCGRLRHCPAIVSATTADGQLSIQPVPLCAACVAGDHLD